MAATEGDLRTVSRCHDLADAAGDHRLRLRDRLLSFGPRSSLGFFIQPMSREFSWGRDVFGLALAVQNLLWGLGQPVAGAIADRFGVLRVMCVGAVLYAGGLLMMRYAATPLSLDLGAGVLIGFGLSGCSFNLVLSAFCKLLPPERRGHRAWRRHRGRIVRAIPVRAVRRGDDRQFRLADGVDVFACLMLLIVPLSLALATPPATPVRCRRRTSSRSRLRWRKRSATGPMCCWCSVSLPAAFSSPSSPCICRPIWSIAA